MPHGQPGFWNDTCQRVLESDVHDSWATKDPSGSHLPVGLRTVRIVLFKRKADPGLPLGQLLFAGSRFFRVSIEIDGKLISCYVLNNDLAIDILIDCIDANAFL